jgi:hypothetical protein
MPDVKKKFNKKLKISVRPRALTPRGSIKAKLAKGKTATLHFTPQAWRATLAVAGYCFTVLASKTLHLRKSR